MSSEKTTKDGSIYTDIVYQVANTVQETDENFIFQTLRNFGLQTYNIIVSKKELCAALELVRHMREEGIDIFECEATASSYSNNYKRGHEAGYREGYSKGYSDAMDNVAEFTEQKKWLEEGRRRKLNE